jgi:hypothetical protein
MLFCRISISKFSFKLATKPFHMKQLLLLCLLPSFCFAQSQTYGTLRAVDFNYASTDPAFGGLFSVGGKGKYIGAGAGVGLISIPNSSSPYIPVFFELVAFSSQKRVRPYGSFDIGYGIYQNEINGSPFTIYESGGLFLNPNIGLLCPLKRKSAFLITAGYISSSFSLKGGSPYSQTTASTTSTGWSLGAGFKF